MSCKKELYDKINVIRNRLASNSGIVPAIGQKWRSLYDRELTFTINEINIRHNQPWVDGKRPCTCESPCGRGVSLLVTELLSNWELIGGSITSADATK